MLMADSFMSIYTRTGDAGTTSLFGGKRVLKCEELVDVYGSIDELNSWVGLVASQVTDTETANFLHDIQADLFTLGSMMAGWSGNIDSLKVCAEDMEVWIDTMEKALPELKNFILPGGTTLSSQAHLARAVCRRVERQAVALFSKQPLASLGRSGSAISNQPDVKKIILKYLNRLSDLLFTLARFINKKADKLEVVWSGMKK